MVPLVQNEQEGLELEEEPDLTTLEGFQWEGIAIGSPGSLRKRSLSESSVAVDKTTSVYSLFNNQGASNDNERRQTNSAASLEGITVTSQMPAETVTHVKQEASSLPSSPLISDRTDSVACGRRLSLQTPPDANSLGAFSAKGGQKSPQNKTTLPLESQDIPEAPAERQRMALGLAPSNAIDGTTDSSYTSGNEQNDSQGIGKKRRATGVSD